MGSSLRMLSAAGQLPVLIVGGGLGGFTAALSLHRAGIGNNLIMRESKFSDQPRSCVFLAGSAVRILDRLGLGSQYRALGTPLHHIKVESLRGKEIISFNLNEMGYQVWTVPRADLQQLLLESIPPDSVHFGKKFRSLAVHGDTVQVKLQREAQWYDSVDLYETSFIDTNFVVGADGHNSTVRTFMSRPALTMPSGTMIWRAVVQNPNLEDYPYHMGREIWGVGKRFGFARMNPEEVVWWAILSDCPEVLLRPFTPHLLREFKDFPALTTSLITSTPSDRSIRRTVVKRVWPEQFPWVDQTSKIALVGNAGRPGHFGQFHSGHTYAVEDGYFLACYLAEQKEKGNLESRPSLQGYEENREAQMTATKRYFNQFNRLSLSQSAIKRYFAKKLLQYSMERWGETVKPQLFRERT